MTQNEALQVASDIIADLVRSGNDEVWKSIRANCRKSDGSVDQPKLVAAMLRSTKILADELMAADGGPEADERGDT